RPAAEGDPRQRRRQLRRELVQEAGRRQRRLAAPPRAARLAAPQRRVVIPGILHDPDLRSFACWGFHTLPPAYRPNVIGSCFYRKSRKPKAVSDKPLANGLSLTA